MRVISGKTDGQYQGKRTDMNNSWEEQILNRSEKISEYSLLMFKPKFFRQLNGWVRVFAGGIC